jgi:enoyl-CoA hydratase
MTEALILTEKHDRITLLTLNRPQALNALNTDLINALADAVHACEQDDDCAVIMITGAGRAFVAGADIKEMSQLDFPQNHLDDFISGNWLAVSACRKPTIAAVNGFALGGGCEIAMMCDMIFASEDAIFAQPEITLGTLPGMGGSQRMARAIGKAKTMDMVLSARKMGAQEALDSGLVSRLIKGEDFITQAIAAAQEIARHSIASLIMTKDAVNQAFEMDLEEGLRYERLLFRSSFALADRKEGMEAFVEKRPANFKDK